MSRNPLFDPGLQPERTALAWRRTALSLAVCALVALRLLPPVLGLWSFAAAFAGIAFVGVMWVLAGRRARGSQKALLSSSQPLPDGGLPLVLAVAVTAGALLGLMYVVRLE